MLSRQKSVIKTIIKSNNKHLLFVDDFTFKLITEAYSTQHFLLFNIVGVIMIDEIIPEDYINTNFDIVIFVSPQNKNNIKSIIDTYKNNIAIYFSNYVDKQSIEILCKSNVNTIGFYQFNRLFVSNYCAICEPNKDKYISLERNYDENIQLLIPWHYESMLRFYKITLPLSYDDNIYNIIKYMSYGDIMDFISKELSKITIEKTKKITEIKESKAQYNVIDHLLQREKILGIHSSALIELEKNIAQQNIYKISECEQNYVVGNGTTAELEFVSDKLKNANRKTISEKKNIINYIFTTVYSENKFLQYVPKLKNIIESNMKNHDLYIYIDNFMTYEEICFVENYNKNKMNNHVYLFSKSIHNAYHYSIFNCIDDNANIEMEQLYKRTEKYISKQTESIFESIYHDITNLQQFIINTSNSLSTIKFGDSSNDDSENINNITSLLKVCYDKLNKIETITKFEENEKMIIKNKLCILGNEFSRIRAKHNKNIKFIENINKSYEYNENDNFDNDHNKLLDYDVNTGFSRQKINERNAEFEKIYKNMLGLNEMFVELNIIIKLQGELLEKTDHNLVKAVDCIKKGKTELITAQKHQKTGSKLNYILGGLTSILVVLTGIAVKKN